MIVLAALLGIGLIVLMFLTSVLLRYPAVGLVLTSCYLIFELEYHEAPVATIAGIAVYPTDVLILGMLCATLAHARSAMRPSYRPLPPLILILSLIAFNLARGALSFGLGAAANESRDFIYDVVAYCWVASAFPYERRQEVFGRWMLWTGYGLTIISAYHIIKYGGIHSADSGTFDPTTGDFLSLRFLNSDQALLLAASGIYLASLQPAAKGVRRWTPILFIGLAILSQNRSVWVATAAGLVAWIVASPQGSRGRRAAGVSVGAGLGVGFIMSGVLSSIKSEFIHSFTSRGTFEARSSGWTALLADAKQSGIGVQLLGFPFGHGYHRVVEGIAESFAPHNWYVSIFLRAGLLGLLAWVAVLALWAWNALKSRLRASLLPLVVAVAVYQYAYSLDWPVVPVLAFVTALSGTSRAVSTTRSSVALIGARFQDDGPER